MFDSGDHYTANGQLETRIHERATGVLSRAFQVDPLFTCLVPAEERRRRALPVIFAPMLRDAARRGGVLAFPNAALTWLPAGNLRANLLTQIWHGYGLVPFYVGPSATLRLQNHEDFCIEIVVKHGSREAAYIQAIGVEPTDAGRGVGTKLVTEALSRISLAHRICVLRTEQPKNVAFYEKLGFRCVEQITRPELGIPTWFFARELTG